MGQSFFAAIRITQQVFHEQIFNQGGKILPVIARCLCKMPMPFKEVKEGAGIKLMVILGKRIFEIILPMLVFVVADDDVDLRLGNMPPIIGRQGAEEAFRQFWSTLTGMSHERQQLVLEGNCAFQGSIVTYTRLDGKKVSMPVASHLRLTPEGRSDRLWIYIDLAPLYSED